MEQMKHHIEGRDRRTDRRHVGELARAPLHAPKVGRKQTAPAKRAHAVSGLGQTPAKIRANEPAAAKHDAGGLLSDHRAPKINRLEMSQRARGMQGARGEAEGTWCISAFRKEGVRPVERGAGK
jgi:hypothetical protein